MEPKNLGAIERPKDERDIQLASVPAFGPIPASYIPDMSWLTRNYQGDTPACGAHAASHFQAILEHELTPGSVPRYTPRFSWIRIKTFDGYPLSAGTDMRSIFKSLTTDGADDFEPLENDVTLPLATYSEVSAITPEMTANAATKTINSYAFGATDFASLCQYINQYKAVLLLIKCDDGFWGTSTPTFTTPTYGHFVCAYGYDADSIRIIDSADPNNAYALKTIHAQFVTPTFFLESGTAIDLPPAVKQALISSTTTPLVPSVQQALTSGQLNLAEQILNDIEATLTLIKQEV